MNDLKEQALAILGKLLYRQEHPKFRENQMRIIRSLLNGKNTLAILPTGSGKSVCYQVPAFMLPGVTVVISPLISLIEDQVDALLGNPNEEIRKKVACISSDFIADKDGKHLSEKNRKTGKAEKSRSRLWKEVLLDASKGAYKLLYITAERLRRADFVRFMSNAEIGLFVVDEAHCVSMYGYEFRPRYLEIGRIFAKSGKRPPVAAFTATATKAVTEDILTYLDMKKPKIITANTKARRNLHYSVLRVPESADTETKVFNQKMKALTRFLSAHPDESGFVYCTTVKTVNKVFKSLSKAGYSVTRYYAALAQSPETEESKDDNFRKFLNGEKKIIVSTTALGMGINKTDVRFVVHFNLPLCMENYAQASGRAGRDGKDAYCMLLYHPSDKNTCEKLVNQTVFSSNLSEGDKAKRKRISDLRLERMRHFAETGENKSSDELQAEMLAYFDNFDPRDGALDLDRKKLDVYKTVRKIDVLYCNRTDVAWHIRRGICSAENLNVSSSSHHTVSFRVTDENGKTGAGMLSYFDMMIADAVYTLQFHRKKRVTARAVMGILAGDASLTLRPDRKERVEQSILKMLRMHIEIDRRNSVSVGYAYENESKAAVLSGKFLPLAANAKGGFDFIDGAPFPLYEYAELTNGQFYTFPFKALKNIARPASDSNLALLHYLLCRIDMMSSPQKKRRTTNRIRMDTVFEVLGVSLPEDPYERARKEETVSQKIAGMLDGLKAIDRIATWTVERENGVRIFTIKKWIYDAPDVISL